MRHFKVKAKVKRKSGQYISMRQRNHPHTTNGCSTAVHTYVGAVAGEPKNTWEKAADRVFRERAAAWEELAKL